MTSRLRIGLDAHMLGSRETGNETYVAGLLGGLSMLDGDFDICVYHEGDSRPSGRRHLTPRRLISSNPWVRLGVDLPLRSLSDHIDVLHMTYAVPLWSRCPNVVTVHDISFVTNPEWFSERDLRVLSRAVPWSINRAARVITVSDTCRQQIIKHFNLPAERVVRVYNGPGPAAQRVGDAEARRAVAELGIDLARRYILAVGNLQPRKNLERLVRAFRGIAARCPDVDLVLVGAARYMGSGVLAAGAEAEGRIRFTGYIDDRQLAACYELATVFAFPSLFEGFGIPAIEAMAHEVPVACSGAGALSEVCADAAEYFDPLDEDSIGDVLLKLLSDDGVRRQLIAKGLARTTGFSWKQAAVETLATYATVVGR